jgi:hypothetical protein
MCEDCIGNFLMPQSIYEDAIARPDLFHWFGIAESEFDRWLNELPLRVHPGLVSFWRHTGGGVIFESETLLGPLVSTESDNVLHFNEHHWNLGLPSDLLIFHAGVRLSASCVDVRRHRNRIVVLKSDSYAIEQWFDTFDKWYQNTLRTEFAGRYGMRP